MTRRRRHTCIHRTRDPHAAASPRDPSPQRPSLDPRLQRGEGDVCPEGRALFLENPAPINAPRAAPAVCRPRPRTAADVPSARVAHCSVAQRQGNRLLTGRVKVRVLPLQRRRHAPLSAGPRRGQDFQAPSQLDRPSTRFVNGRVRFDSGRGLHPVRRPRRLEVRISAFQAGDVGFESHRGHCMFREAGCELVE